MRHSVILVLCLAGLASSRTLLSSSEDEGDNEEEFLELCSNDAGSFSLGPQTSVISKFTDKATKVTKLFLSEADSWNFR